MDEDESEITFEEQLALEEKERKIREDSSNKGVKVDPDGTVYDWDAEKKAWFPRISEDFLAQYHMRYGSDVPGATTSQMSSDTSSKEAAVDFASIPPMPDMSDPSYADWYYKYAAITSTQEYKDWYDYYYGGSRTEGVADDSGDVQSAGPALEPHDERYWEDLKQQGGSSLPVEEEEEDEEEENGDKKKKKKKPKPPPKPEAWFDMQDENNTNVYISGLPPTINMESFKELTNKCGLIAFDPLTKKPKLKLYKDENGKPKGDGLCCFIKVESVDLAMKILDGCVLDGHTLKVEPAKFELKGNFDPKKRTKRKMTNKEKKAYREKQAKLFEWRPDKPRFARARHEKVVVVKNVFSVLEINEDPLLMNELEQDMTSECSKFGQVKKVRVHDRNTDGVVSITFAEAEEADACKAALNGRWFACRQLSAETWDGKTKYDVQETEEEYQARLKKWEEFLQQGASTTACNPAPSATAAAAESQTAAESQGAAAGGSQAAAAGETGPESTACEQAVEASAESASAMDESFETAPPNT